MKLKFDRIISSGKFIPEIDGLRFIAIFSVFMFHLSGFIVAKDQTQYKTTYDFDWLTALLSRGHLGVPIFFIISGFILAKPFANFYLKDGKKIKLKDFYIRRITRIEPPYFIVMTALLLGMIFVVKKIPPIETLKSYLSSMTYTHNFFYGEGVLPKLNAVAWSLEVEIQFYILSPFFALIFTLKKKKIRRTITV